MTYSWTRSFGVVLTTAVSLFLVAACSGGGEESTNDGGLDSAVTDAGDAQADGDADADNDGDTDTDTDTDADTDVDSDADGDLDGGPDCSLPPDGGNALPDGWAGAELTEVYIGPSPIVDAGFGPDIDASVIASLNGNTIRLLVENTQFDCVIEEAGGVEGFVRKRTGGYDVLIQPADMCSWTSACGTCYQNVRLNVGASDAGAEVALYLRNSFRQESDHKPKLIDTVTASTPMADCDILVSCDAGVCPDGGSCVDDFDQEKGCTSLPSCGGNFCAWDKEACFLECGTATCTLAETMPLTVTCP